MNRKTFLSLFFIATGMRLFMIGRAPLWYDENFTLILARLPFAQMMQATAGDVHPPLWYLIEWILFHALPSLPAWAIRIPALTFSLLAFVMFVRVCDVINIPSRVQVAAAFMMAVLPMQIWYAQEGRMYAMLEFLVLAALYAGLTRKWFYFFIASLAMLYTQNYGLFYVIVIGFILIVVDWKDAMMTILSVFATALLYMPWVFVIANQMHEISGRYWIMDVTPGGALKIVYQQFWSSSMMEPGIVSAYVITFAALIIGMYYLMSEKHNSWFIVIAMAFAPLAIAWIASVIWQPLLISRPLIGTAPFLYLIVAWPIEQLFLYRAPLYIDKDVPNKKMLYAACFIVPVIMFGIGGYYINIANMKGEGAVSPLLDALTYVRANWQEGDVIYYTDDGPMINIMPYAADLPQYKMPGCEVPILGTLSSSTRAALDVRITELRDVTHTRAWVFAPRSPLHPRCYEDQIAQLTIGAPIIAVDDNEYISSGVWLVEK